MIQYIDITQKNRSASPANTGAISYSMGGIHTGVFPVFEHTDYKDIKHTNRNITDKPAKHMPGFRILNVLDNQISLSCC